MLSLIIDFTDQAGVPAGVLTNPQMLKQGDMAIVW